MKADFHRNFDNQFTRLPKAEKTQVIGAIELFLDDPVNASLRNHPLSGEWARYRSITAANDLRIHFRVINEDRVLFVAVGSHDQLYR